MHIDIIVLLASPSSASNVLDMSQTRLAEKKQFATLNFKNNPFTL